MLTASEYRGAAFEDEVQSDPAKKSYSFSELMSIVQASEQELRAALTSMNTLEINGKYRVLEYAFMAATFKEVLAIAFC